MTRFTEKYIEITFLRFQVNYPIRRRRFNEKTQKTKKYFTFSILRTKICNKKEVLILKIL